jgi:hypothetical protein
VSHSAQDSTTVRKNPVFQREDKFNVRKTKTKPDAIRRSSEVSGGKDFKRSSIDRTMGFSDTSPD